MTYRTSLLVGWVFTVLDTLVLGIPVAIVVVEIAREGRIDRPSFLTTLLYFGIAWLLLLVVWLAVGHLNPRRARFAWYSLVISFFAMFFVVMRPRPQ
jgi:hypothetical protein